LQVKKGEELRRELQVSTVPSLQKLPDLIADTGVLEKLVEEVICAAGE
jgi:hypothetical protein